MKTLIKLANSTKIEGIGGYILFEGNAARATDATMHAVIESGPWNFDCATLVSVQQIKTALTLAKKPGWEGDTLNGIKLVSAGTTDWPTLPDVRQAKRIITDNLSASMLQCAPAMADRDIRYYLNGMLFDHTERVIVGCDGHRLHIVHNAFTSELTGQTIVPRDALDLAGVKNILHMDFTDKYVRVGYVGGYIVTPLCDGKFPDYSRVLPDAKSRPNIVAFNGKHTDAVKTICSVNKANKAKFPTIAIDADGSLNSCAVKLPCFDQFKVTRLNDKNGLPTGQDFYGINANYLHDAMLSAHYGIIGVDSANDSILVINGDFRAVVMPFRA